MSLRMLAFFAIGYAFITAFVGTLIYQQEISKARQPVFESLTASSANLSAKAETVLDDLFSHLEDSPSWLVARGDVALKGDKWVTKVHYGKVDKPDFGGFLKNNRWASGAYLWSPQEMLFVKKLTETKWQWRVTKFVPMLMNLTMELDRGHMRLLVNEKGQILGVTQNRARQIYHRLLDTRPNSARLINKGEALFARGLQRVPHSNLTAIAISQVPEMSRAAYIRFWIKTGATGLLGFAGLLFLFSSNSFARREPIEGAVKESAKKLSNESDKVPVAKEAREEPKKEPVKVIPEPAPRAPADKEVRETFQFIANLLKVPVMASMAQARVMKTQKMSEAAERTLQGLESEARKSREIVDLISLFAQAEDYPEESVDVLEAFRSFRSRYSTEFNRGSFRIEVPEGSAHVKGSDSHLRRSFEYFAKHLSDRLSCEWELTKSSGVVELTYQDRNGAITDTEWSSLGYPHAEGRPRELSLALAALMGSFEHFGGEVALRREANGFSIRIRTAVVAPIARPEPRIAPPPSAPPSTSVTSETDVSPAPDFTDAMKMTMEEVSEEAPEESPEGNLPLVAISGEGTENGREDEVDGPPAGMIVEEDKPQLIEVPDLAPQAPTPPIQTHAPEDPEDATAVMVQAEFVPKDTESLIGGDLPDLGLAEKRRKPIDDFKVSVREAKKTDRTLN